MRVVGEVGKQRTRSFGIVLVVFPYLEKLLQIFSFVQGEKHFSIESMWNMYIPVSYVNIPH